MEQSVLSLIGVIIGAGAIIIANYVQTKAQSKRERMKLAAELALEDFKLSLEHVKEQAKISGSPFSITPPVVYIHYYAKLLEALESGKLDEARIQELTEANRKVTTLVKEANKNRNA